MDFNKDTRIQAIDYIIRNSSNTHSLDKISILKLLFFADIYHLRKYGRTISNDSYCAMQNGPVASKTYDLLKSISNEQELEKDGLYNIKSRGAFLEREDYDCLSDTDIEALDFSINNFSKFSSKELIRISHLYPEWKRFEKELAKVNTSYAIQIDDFFSKTTEDTKEYEIISANQVALNQELIHGKL